MIYNYTFTGHCQRRLKQRFNIGNPKRFKKEIKLDYLLSKPKTKKRIVILKYHNYSIALVIKGFKILTAYNNLKHTKQRYRR